MSKFNSRKLRRFQDVLVRVNYTTVRDGHVYSENTTGVIIERSKMGATIKFMNEDPILTISYDRLISVELPYLNKGDSPT
jgi:hypothetical protein